MSHYYLPLKSNFSASCPVSAVPSAPLARHLRADVRKRRWGEQLKMWTEKRNWWQTGYFSNILWM